MGLPQIMTAGLIGALLEALIPGAGALSLVPLGIGCVLSIVLLVEACEPENDERGPSVMHRFT
jgi:hypothetical protein